MIVIICVFIYVYAYVYIYTCLQIYVCVYIFLCIQNSLLQSSICALTKLFSSRIPILNQLLFSKQNLSFAIVDNQEGFKRQLKRTLCVRTVFNRKIIRQAILRKQRDSLLSSLFMMLYY
jgi:hypothetical protein